MRMLLTNGTILTMDDQRPRAEAVLVDGGRVSAVGGLEELRGRLAPGSVHEIDLEGNTLLPGFVDGHSHIVHCAQSLLFAQLGQARSFADMLECLRAYIRENNVAPGEWVVGTGYDPQMLREKGHPTRPVLDALEAWPVLVTADSGHMGCMNRTALRAAGITADTPAPQGGRIGHDENGEPNGYLEEAAFTAMQRFIPPVTAQRLLHGLERAQRLYASYGVTTAQEGLLQPDSYALLKKADEAGRLWLDVVGYADIRTRDDLPHDQPRWGLREGRFRVGGYKLFLDGSPQGRTAWLTKPYRPKEGQPADYRGYPMLSLEEAAAYVDLAARDNEQLLTHCNGDAAIDRLLDATKRPTALRNVIVHAQTMRLDQLERVRALGLMPSYFVAHVERYGDQHIQNLGMERAALISPVASTARLGIPYTLHQDTPVMPPDMAGTVGVAMRRVTQAGVTLGEGERVSMLQALRGITTYGAYQCFEETEKGMLRAGMRADFVVMQGDWPHMSAQEIAASKALLVYKDGMEIPRS